LRTLLTRSKRARVGTAGLGDKFLNLFAEKVHAFSMKDNTTLVYADYILQSTERKDHDTADKV